MESIPFLSFFNDRMPNEPFITQEIRIKYDESYSAYRSFRECDCIFLASPVYILFTAMMRQVCDTMNFVDDKFWKKLSIKIPGY